MVARGRRENTARQWRAGVVRFEACCGSKRKYDRDDVVRYLSWMRRQGFKDDSIALMLRPVKLLAQIQGWEFPCLAMPKVRDSDISRPAFSYEEVCLMIRRGREVLSARELAYLALSTTYGLRRVELGSLGAIDGTVTVDTVKGGLVTTHLVPDEIKPYLAGYKRSRGSYMSLVFRRMVKKLGLEGRGKYGWHSIRRALTTELVSADVGLLNILRFMRWSDASLKGQFGMVAIYAVHDQEQIDKSIFAVHPFLEAWRNEVKGEQNESVGTSPLTSGEVVDNEVLGGRQRLPEEPPIVDAPEKLCGQNLGYFIKYTEGGVFLEPLGKAVASEKACHKRFPGAAEALAPRHLKGSYLD